MSVLGGPVQAVFKFGKPEDYAVVAEKTRQEQEAMCGYALKIAGLRQTHTVDDKGNNVYEVFATLEPADEPPESTVGVAGSNVATE